MKNMLKTNNFFHVSPVKETGSSDAYPHTKDQGMN